MTEDHDPNRVSPEIASLPRRGYSPTSGGLTADTWPAETREEVRMHSHSRKEQLWLTCREKTCCMATRVVVTGSDIWRISQAMELMPWNFTLYCPVDRGVSDGFQLKPGGEYYQVILARRIPTGSDEAGNAPTAPCRFLWRLPDGHAQCGLGGLKPLVCEAYPAVLRTGGSSVALAAESPTCTCRQWAATDLEGESDMARLLALREETAEYSEIVAHWNHDLSSEGDRTYKEFCSYLLDTYSGRRQGAV